MFDPLTNEKFPDPIRMQVLAGELFSIFAEAQRNLDYNRVAKMVPFANPAKLGVITISIREDGTTHVIDGQHRCELARQVWGAGFPMECEVFEGLTPEQEALLFLARNDQKAVGTYPRFVASVTAKDPAAVAVVEILRGVGLVHSNQKKTGAVCAVAALLKVYGLSADKDGVPGPVALARSLLVVQRAWGSGTASFEGHLIEGIGRLYARFGRKLDTDALVTKLSTYKGGAAGVLGTARLVRDTKGKAVAQCVASVVADQYNKGRRSGSLGDWWAKR